MIQMAQDMWAELKFRLTDPMWGAVPLWVALVAISLVVMIFVSFVTPLIVKQITYGMIFLVWFLAFFVSGMTWLAMRMIGEIRFRSFLASQNKEPENLP